MSKFFIWQTEQTNFNSADFGILIKKIKRSLLPPISTPTVKAGKRAGEILQENTLGAREITIDYAFMSDNEAYHRKEIRDLAGALFSKREGKLFLSDELDVFYYAQLTGNSDLDSIASMGEGTFTFFCGDPFAYKEERSAFFTGNSLTFWNDGTAPTYPQIRIEPTIAVSYIKYRNEETGEHVLLNGDFPAGEAVIVDHQKNLVYFEATGQRIMTAVDLSTDFFALEPQKNTLITVEPLDQLTASLFFQDRYL